MKMKKMPKRHVYLFKYDLNKFELLKFLAETRESTVLDILTGCADELIMNAGELEGMRENLRMIERNVAVSV